MIIIDEVRALIYSAVYTKKGWNTKGCGLIPQADRINAAHAYLKVLFNWPGEGASYTEKTYTTEDGTEAFYEPVPEGTIAGFPYYKGLYNNFILLTYNNKVPWVPVTIGEYLDREEGRIMKGIKEYNNRMAREKQPDPDDAKIQRSYEEFKKTNHKFAEEYLKNMEQLKATQSRLKPQIEAQNKKAGEYLQKELQDLKTYRAGLGPVRLKEQARFCTAMGDNRKYQLCLPNDKSTYQRNLVKLAPEYLDTPGNNKIRLISIAYSQNSPEPGWQELLQKTLETLNYKALTDLMK